MVVSRIRRNAMVSTVASAEMHWFRWILLNSALSGDGFRNSGRIKPSPNRQGPPSNRIPILADPEYLRRSGPRKKGAISAEFWWRRRILLIPPPFLGEAGLNSDSLKSEGRATGMPRNRRQTPADRKYHRYPRPRQEARSRRNFHGCGGCL